MRLLNFCSFVLLSTLGGVFADGPIVDLGYAKYQGSVNSTTNIASFLGVRYADAPLGDLRFRAPQPPPFVSGVQQATLQPPECPQASDGQSPTNPFPRAAALEPEDCLFLNVYHPTNVTRPLPVVVWIHGGGYVAGNASFFSGSVLIEEANFGIVSVIIQYRLGVYGFLPGTKVKENGALNAGLLDQDFALRWVNKNIRLFGGDPTQVTIWGGSAGAGSVLQHVVAQNGNTQPQLFRAAITSSTFVPSQYEYNARIPELLFSEVASQTSCSTAADTMACLRAVDFTVLQAANTGIGRAAFFGTYQFVPVVDGTFITQRPTLSLAQGKLNGRALYSVTNSFEGKIFVNASNPMNASFYSQQLFPEFTSVQTAKVAALYRDQGTDLDQDIAIMGESIFICPTYYFLNAFPYRSFKAEFAIPPGTHGEDLPYYFGGNPGFNNPDFIKAFSHTFMSFIMFMNPNIKYTPTITPDIWPFFALGHTEMLFNRTEDFQPLIKTITTDNGLLERCAFWHSVGALIGQ